MSWQVPEEFFECPDGHVTALPRLDGKCPERGCGKSLTSLLERRSVSQPDDKRSRPR